MDGPESQAFCCLTVRLTLRASETVPRASDEPLAAKAQRMGRQPITCQVRLTWRGALAQFLLQLCDVAFVFFCLGGAPPPQ